MLYYYKGRLVDALIDLFSDISFDKSMFSTISMFDSLTNMILLLLTLLTFIFR